MKRAALAIVANAILVSGVLMAPAGAASAQPPGHDRSAVQSQRHSDVVSYWTAARVKSAVPADVVLDERGKRVATKGKPGGGTGTSVLGASWTGGGRVLATTGKVLFTMGGSNYVCSGSVAQDAASGRAIVLTAGHCVYDDVANAFATNWLFVPAFDTAPTFSCAATTYGCWTATSLVSTNGWAASDFNVDVGFAVLGTGGLSGTAQADDVVGAQPIAFNTVHPTTIHAFGYPAEGSYNGNDLVYCAGTDAKDTTRGSTTYGLPCAMNGGSSGGPWFREFATSTGVGTLTSVNSYSYRGVKNRMFGPYLGATAANAFAAAQSTTTNTLVN